MEENKENLWLEIPIKAWVSLARRGMEGIKLDQCFLKDCDNQDINLLEPFKKEEFEDKQKQVKRIHIKCKKCNRIFQLELITLKRVAKPTKGKNEKIDDDEGVISMGLVNALDEKGNNLGHIGYF